MMEKNGVIREGLTPPEDGVQEQPPLEVATDLLKRADEHFARLEEHMTKRSHTCITENLK